MGKKDFLFGSRGGGADQSGANVFIIRRCRRGRGNPGGGDETTQGEGGLTQGEGTEPPNSEWGGGGGGGAQGGGGVGRGEGGKGGGGGGGGGGGNGNP